MIDTGIKIGIMQPYFFPYLGYFSLIKHTDKFVLIDTVQFIRHGWIERNRILKPGEGWQYIKVPLQKHHQITKIRDIYINNSINWKNKIIKQLQHYTKKAPYFSTVIYLLEDIFSEDFYDIVTLNQYSISKVCEYLGIKNEIKVFSKMNLNISEPTAPDEWALNICKALGNIDEYWNPIGGKEIFNPDKFIKEEIELKFHRINLMNYYQKRNSFEPGLSIIDVMMFNSIEEINTALDNYEIN